MRITYLDGLRGIACLMVILIHAGGLGLRNFGATANHLVDVGQFGVTIFFVLSGYSLCLGGHVFEANHAGWRAFYIKRAFRILPLYFLVLVAVVALSQASPNLTSVVAHLTFANILFPAYSNDLIGVEWTMPVEVTFYLLFPLIVWVTRRLPWLVAIAVLGAMTIYYWIFVSRFLDVYTHYTFFGHAYAFLVGPLIYFAVHKARLVHRFVAPFLLAGAGYAAWSCLTTDITLYTGPIMAAAAALVILAAEGSKIIAVGLSLFRLFGKISFPLYLVHMPLLQALPSSPWLAVALSMVLAVVLHYAVELPSQRVASEIADTR